MQVGILGAPPRVSEGRVLLTPRHAGVLEDASVRVLVESGAGVRAGFADADYLAEGGELASRAEILESCDIVLSVARPTLEEAAKIRAGSTLMGFLHSDAGGVELAGSLSKQGAIAIGIERCRTASGRYPFRERMAQVAGVLCMQLAARLLESGPGPGILLGGVSGVPPANVAVIGAGALGRAATRAFAGAGASVLVLDRGWEALEMVEHEGMKRVRTLLSSPADIADAAAWADVLVGAVRVPEGPPPKLLAPFQGKTGSVWLDLSVDEGGCLDGSRPVYSADDAYTVDGILYCPIPNLASRAAQTASRVMSALLTPALLRAAEAGSFDLGREPWLAEGVATR